MTCLWCHHVCCKKKFKFCKNNVLFLEYFSGQLNVVEHLWSFEQKVKAQGWDSPSFTLKESEDFRIGDFGIFWNNWIFYFDAFVVCFVYTQVGFIEINKSSLTHSALNVSIFLNTRCSLIDETCRVLHQMTVRIAA